MRIWSRHLRHLLLAGLILILLIVALPTPHSAAQVQEGSWFAQYYSNRTLSGPVTFSETLPGPYLDREWMWGFGPQNGVPDDNWSARFTTLHRFPGGNVKFMLNSDDGSRLYLNGQVIIDEWHDRAGTYYTARVLNIPAGQYQIAVEYYEAYGTNLVEARFEPTTDLPSAPDVNFRPAPFPGTAVPTGPMSGQGATAPVPIPQSNVWSAEYYSNPTLQAPVTFRETLPGPYLDVEWLWGFGPQNGVPDDNWSARFTTRYQFPGGNVKFMLNSDDGSKLYLNGQVIIDEWHPRAGTYYTARVLPIPAGTYTIMVEYYESHGNNLVEARFEPTLDLPAAPDMNFRPAGAPGGGVIAPTAPTAGQGGGGQPGVTQPGVTQGVPGTPPAAGVVVDANTAGFVWSGSEAWVFSFGGLLDNLYIYNWNSSFAYDTWGRWNVDLPKSGYWDAYAYIPPNSNGTLNARYRVSHAGVLGPVISVNQRTSGGSWVWLGNYWFNSGASQYVYLNDLTFEPEGSTWVLFDAVKLTFGAQQ